MLTKIWDVVPCPCNPSAASGGAVEKGRQNPGSEMRWRIEEYTCESTSDIHIHPLCARAPVHTHACNIHTLKEKYTFNFISAFLVIPMALTY